MNSLLRVITKKYAKLIVSMLLVTSLGCGIMSGMSDGFLSLKQTLDSYIEEMQYPDLVITTSTTTKDRADALRELEGVEAVNPRLNGNLVLVDKDGRFISVVASTYQEDDFQKFHYWETGDKNGEYPILLEHAFCDANGIHAGDQLEVRLGERKKLCTVYGIVSTPETLAVPSLGRLKFTSSDFCYMFIPASLLEDEENPEYQKALEEWEKKNREYAAAKQKADAGHEKALKELADGQKELSDKGQELNDGILDAEGQINVLKKNQSELRMKLQELDDQEKKLAEMKETLKQGERSLQKEKKKLADAKDEIDKKRGVLDQKKLELEAESGKLEEKLAEAKSTLEEGRKKLAEWKRYIRLIEEYEEQIRTYTKRIKLPTSTYERGKALVESIGRILSDTNLVIEKLKNVEDEVAGIDLSILYESMGKYASRLLDLQDRLIYELQHLQDPAKIEEIREKVVSLSSLFLDKFVQGSGTVADVVEAILSYVRNMESELEKGEKQLKQYEGYRTKIREGLEAVQAGYEELAPYEAQIKKGEQQIRDAEAKLASYRKQIADGETRIADGRRTVYSYLAEIEKAIAAIEQGIRDGRAGYDEAAADLQKAKEELADQWLSVLQELSDGEKELLRTKKDLDSWEGYDALCNQFLIRLREGADPANVQRQAEAVLGDLEIKESFTYETSPVKHKIDVNLDPIEVMAVYVPLIFFGVALIVVSLFMNLLVRRCRREVGILRALGFSKSSIALQFSSVSLVTSLGAVIVGTLLGIGVSRFIGIFFRDFFDLYKMDYQFYWERFLLAVAITIGVGQVATLLSMFYVNRVAPVEAMTRPAPKAAVHMGGFMRNGNTFFKYCLFTLIRNKARFFVSVVCLSASVMLILVGFAFGASKDKVLSSYFEDRINYDCEVFFSYKPAWEKLEQLADQGLVRDPELVGYYEKEIRHGNVSAKATFQSISKDTEKVRVFDAEGRRIPLQEDGLILEQHLADTLGVEVGDEVSMDGVAFPVIAVSEQYEGYTHYIMPKAAERLGEPGLWSVLVDTDPDKEPAFIQGVSEVGGYVFSSVVKRNYDFWLRTFKAFTACVILVILFAVMIGYVIVTNTLRTNLLEQKRDLCVLRTLGFQHSELSFRLFFQAGMYYLFASVIGIPVGAMVTKLVLHEMETDGRTYPFVNEPYLYLLTAGLVLVYLVFGHITSMRTLKKWDIVECVKDKE